MSVQVSASNKNFGFLRYGEAKTKTGTILQDAARATPLVFGTVLAQVAASRKWVPLTDVTAVATGENTARGIFIGDNVTAAALVAGDVLNQQILIGGPCTIDAQQVVLENNVTLSTVVSDDPAGADNGVVNVRVVEDDLMRIGIFVEDTLDITALEN